jgi:hypothetical protein
LAGEATEFNRANKFHRRKIRFRLLRRIRISKQKPRHNISKYGREQMVDSDLTLEELNVDERRSMPPVETGSGLHIGAKSQSFRAGSELFRVFSSQPSIINHYPPTASR